MTDRLHWDATSINRCARGVTLLEFAITLAIVGLILTVVTQLRAHMEANGGSQDDSVQLAALRLASALDTLGRLPQPRAMVPQGSKLIGELDVGTFSANSSTPLLYEVESILVSGPLRRYSPNKLGESFGQPNSPSAVLANVNDEQRADLCTTLEYLARASFGKAGHDAAVAWVYPKGSDKTAGHGWAAIDFYSMADCPAVLNRLNAAVDTWYTFQDHIRVADLLVKKAEMDTRAAKYSLANVSARLGIWSAAFLTGVGGTKEAFSELHTSKVTGKKVFATILAPSVLVSGLYVYGIGLTIYMITEAAPALEKAKVAEEVARDYLQRVRIEARAADEAVLDAYTQGRVQ